MSLKIVTKKCTAVVILKLYSYTAACIMLPTVNTDLLEQKPLNFDTCTQIWTEMENYECLKYVVGEGLFCAHMCMSTRPHMW